MDGPFAIDVILDGQALVTLSFLHKDAVKLSAQADLREVLGNAMDVGSQVLASCHNRGWKDRDVGNLSKAMQRGFESLTA